MIRITKANHVEVLRPGIKIVVVELGDSSDYHCLGDVWEIVKNYDNSSQTVDGKPVRYIRPVKTKGRRGEIGEAKAQYLYPYFALYSTPFNHDRPFTLRNGTAVELIDRDGPQDRPLRVRVPGGHVYHYPLNGYHYKEFFDQPIDLVNPEAQP